MSFPEIYPSLSSGYALCDDWTEEDNLLLEDDLLPVWQYPTEAEIEAEFVAYLERRDLLTDWNDCI